MKKTSKVQGPKSVREPSLRKQVETIIYAGTASSTRKSYERDTRYFWVWAKLRKGKRMRYPVSIELIQQFIVDHVNGLPKKIEDKLIEDKIRSKRGPFKISTIRRHLSSLSVIQQEKGFDSILAQAQVRLILRRARISRAGEETTNKKAAITKEILEKMIKTCGKSLHDKRDKALLLVGFGSGGRRRSELTNMRYEDVRETNEGYIITLRRSKTDQIGKGREVPVMGKAAIALREWIKASKILDGYLFRGIRNNNQLNNCLTAKNVGLLIKKRIEMIGLDPSKYSGHSLRSGFVTSAALDGMSLAAIMQLTGHSNAEVCSNYIREQSLANHPVKDLL